MKHPVSIAFGPMPQMRGKGGALKAGKGAEASETKSPAPLVKEGRGI